MTIGDSNITYATLGMLKTSLNWAGTAEDELQLYRALRSGTDSCHTLLRRLFYPEQTTLYFDYPSNDFLTQQALLLRRPIVSVTSLVSGGETIPGGAIQLMNWCAENDQPPYKIVRLDNTQNYVFQSGVSSQRAVALTGLFSSTVTETSIISATIESDITDTDTSVVLAPKSAGLLIPDVGSLILVGSEYMICQSVGMITSGQSLQTSMTDTINNRAVVVTDGTQFAIGEYIQIDDEVMFIVGITGNTLRVKRAVADSILETHTAGISTLIYARRQFMCVRGAVGSTAVAHSAGTNVFTHEYPPLLTELCIAETLVHLEQLRSAYARTIGSGPYAREATNKGLEDIRSRALQAFGRTLNGAV